MRATVYLYDANSSRRTFAGMQPAAGAQIFVSYLAFPPQSGLAALLSAAGGGAGLVLLLALLFGLGGLLALKLYQWRSSQERA